MKAVVLCAGKGTRLGSLTSRCPKAMLPLANRPLIDYTLAYLAEQGIAEVAINVCYRADMITNHVGDGAQFGLAVRYSHETEPLGTAGALHPLQNWLKGAPSVLMLYGDLLIDQPLIELIDVHRSNNAFATLLVHRRTGSNSVVEIAPDGRILQFLERPQAEQRGAIADPWVNSGMQVLSSEAVSDVISHRAIDLPRDVYMPKVGTKGLYGVPITGYRCAIDSPVRYREAEVAVRTGSYRMPAALTQ